MFEEARNKKGQIEFIRERCAGRSEEELKEAEALYIRYLELIWRIAKNNAKRRTPPSTPLNRDSSL